MDAFEQNRSEAMPRMGNALTRWIGRSLMSLIGWTLDGKVADEPRLIIVGAPHTSNWDLYLAMGTSLALGLRFSWMMKKEAFFWPLGGLWKALGGIPIDRKSKNDVTQQMVDVFKRSDKLWLGITPEGTRSKVGSYRKGYLRIAYAANVPIQLIAVDGINKSIVLDQIWSLTGDIEQDNDAIKDYYDRTYTGINADKS